MKKLMVSFIDGISNKRVVTVHSLYRPKTDASFSRNFLENSSEIFFFPLFIYSFFLFLDGTLCFMQWILKQPLSVSVSRRVCVWDIVI